MADDTDDTPWHTAHAKHSQPSRLRSVIPKLQLPDAFSKPAGLATSIVSCDVLPQAASGLQGAAPGTTTASELSSMPTARILQHLYQQAVAEAKANGKEPPQELTRHLDPFHMRQLGVGRASAARDPRTAKQPNPPPQCQGGASSSMHSTAAAAARQQQQDQHQQQQQQQEQQHHQHQHQHQQQEQQSMQASDADAVAAAAARRAAIAAITRSMSSKHLHDTGVFRPFAMTRSLTAKMSDDSTCGHDPDSTSPSSLCAPQQRLSRSNSMCGSSSCGGGGSRPVSSGALSWPSSAPPIIARSKSASHSMLVAAAAVAAEPEAVHWGAAAAPVSQGAPSDSHGPAADSCRLLPPLPTFAATAEHVHMGDEAAMMIGKGVTATAAAVAAAHGPAGGAPDGSLARSCSRLACSTSSGGHQHHMHALHHHHHHQQQQHCTAEAASEQGSAISGQSSRQLLDVTLTGWMHGHSSHQQQQHQQQQRDLQQQLHARGPQQPQQQQLVFAYSTPGQQHCGSSALHHCHSSNSNSSSKSSDCWNTLFPAHATQLSQMSLLAQHQQQKVAADPTGLPRCTRSSSSNSNSGCSSSNGSSYVEHTLGRPNWQQSRQLEQQTTMHEQQREEEQQQQQQHADRGSSGGSISPATRAWQACLPTVRRPSSDDMAPPQLPNAAASPAAAPAGSSSRTAHVAASKRRPVASPGQPHHGQATHGQTTAPKSLPDKWWLRGDSPLTDPVLLQLPVWVRMGIDLELLESRVKQ